MMQKYINKRYIVLFFLILCICLVFLSVHLYKGSNENSEKVEAYNAYLGQVVEKDFMGEDGIILADAEISYDNKSEEYSIKLSLTADEEISEEQIELYKSILRKTYTEIVLTINGAVK